MRLKAASLDEKTAFLAAFFVVILAALFLEGLMN